jgi:2-keto-3-deoxy-L-rhamnonate aldolase RhmA
MKINQTRQKLRSGRTCLGTMIRDTRSPQIVQLMASAGWDFVILDTEHGPSDMQTLADFASIAHYEETTLLVRVPDNEYHLLARVLDNGAEGLICPQVNSRREAEAIIAAVKYAPLGAKGVSISGIGTGFRAVNLAEYLQAANENTLVVVQIESVEALDLLDEILSVPGIDATMIGPADLSQSMAIPGQFQHPKMIEAYQRVIDACNRHGLAPGAHFQSLEMVKEWMGRGMRFAVYSTDFRLMQEASRNALKTLRG